MSSEALRSHIVGSTLILLLMLVRLVARIVAREDRFAVSFDREELFAANDRTFTGAGMVGLWTKSDSITWFESNRGQASRLPRLIRNET
jgi:hypothetical protein